MWYVSQLHGRMYSWIFHGTFDNIIKSQILLSTCLNVNKHLVFFTCMWNIHFHGLQWPITQSKSILFPIWTSTKSVSTVSIFCVFSSRPIIGFAYWKTDRSLCVWHFQLASFAHWQWKVLTWETPGGGKIEIAWERGKLGFCNASLSGLERAIIKY